MNALSVINELKTYNEHELFYKRCYEFNSDKIALKKYISSFNPQELKKLQFILPGKPITSKFVERNIFEGHQEQNIFLFKHNRYTPAFEHCHDYFEFFYVLIGQCVNSIGKERSVLPEGSLCCIAPYINHTLEVFSDSIIINILIRKTTFDNYFFNLLTTDNILSDFFMGNIYAVKPIEYIIFNIGDDTEMKDKIIDILIEQSKKDKYSSRIMDYILSIFFTLLMRKHGEKLLMHRIGKDTHMQRYITYINEHFRTVTLTEVAKYFSVSIAHCSRLIKTQTGRHFTDLVRDIRLRHAQSLLTSTNMKIYDISYSLGYENQETFIRSFKKNYGATPGQYRQNHSL